MNKKLTCWIIDDEPLALSLLESYIQETPFLCLTGKYNNPALAMQNLLNQKVDLIFLDIQMPHINGMELAYQVPPETKIVFISAFKEYALDGYRVNAFDYLLKPVSFDEFLITCKKVLDWFDAVSENSSGPTTASGSEAIFVKSGQQLVSVLFKDILYIEGLKDYIKVYTTNSSRPFITLETMKNMENILPSNLFIRVHRSFIVQKNKIESVNRNRLTVASREIPIGRTYKQKMLNFISHK
ncbi:MAG: LytTR family DNA-binding domain-containing protein [Proteiniphilum sp.]|jgi:two-component system LytT family response regulator|uniref:LytR/AlgR family response regulator transcription factor n=1 Tax=Proteiniphilum sp. TaxID=1926877 RepID=UPI002B20BD3F|nr:LytTR family DNA-binding domain-containing protein [Proteiniphilum sp.]MEA5127019.1 LytTR family DNA-binding domain-containing protein [Proteiniphilum sp.]